MLRISRMTDYAIVVLAHLAREQHVCVRPTSALAVSGAVGIPVPTVAKVLKTLARGGLVRSTRGARGGYALAQDPAQISVARVLETVEGPLALTACSVETGQECGDMLHCKVSGHWPKVNAAVRAALGGVTILELAHPVEAAATAAVGG